MSETSVVRIQQSQPARAKTRLVEEAPQLSHAEMVAEAAKHAKRLADSHVQGFLALTAQYQAMATEIANGGDVYHAGIREYARRMAAQAGADMQSIEHARAKSANSR